MENAYKARIPTKSVTSLLQLTPLTNLEGKSVPSDKQIRISGGNWKVKDVPGDGKSSSRERHLAAAMKQLPELWHKDLEDRECAHVQSSLYNIFVKPDAECVTSGGLANLIGVVKLIDELARDSGLSKKRCADLLFYVVAVLDQPPLTVRDKLVDAAKFMHSEVQTPEAGYSYAVNKSRQTSSTSTPAAKESKKSTVQVASSMSSSSPPVTRSNHPTLTSSTSPEDTKKTPAGSMATAGVAQGQHIQVRNKPHAARTPAERVHELIGTNEPVLKLINNKLFKSEVKAFHEAVVTTANQLAPVPLSGNRTRQEQAQVNAWRRLGEAYGTLYGAQLDGRSEIFSDEDIRALPLGHRASMVLALAEYASRHHTDPTEKTRAYQCYLRMCAHVTPQEMATQSLQDGEESFVRAASTHLKEGANWNTLSLADKQKHLITYCGLHAKALGYRQPELRFNSTLATHVATVAATQEATTVHINTNPTRGWNDYLEATNSLNLALAWTYQREVALQTRPRVGREGDVARLLRAEILASTTPAALAKVGISSPEACLPLSAAALQQYGHVVQLNADIRSAAGIQGGSTLTQRRLQVGDSKQASSPKSE